jgi:predicted Fe-S protein YdhL (DUF1289 family)
MDEVIELVPVIESPCVNICRVERNICAGCGRTLGEIARWGTTTDADRRAVMALLPARMAKLG